MHPNKLHFVTINSYLTSLASVHCRTIVNTSLLFCCLRLGTSLPALHALDLTVIWPNAASSSPCLHDVSLTTTTVVTLVCLFAKVIQQIDSVLPAVQVYESASLWEQQLRKLVSDCFNIIGLFEGNMVIFWAVEYTLMVCTNGRDLLLCLIDILPCT